jgi:toxin YoeB
MTYELDISATAQEHIEYLKRSEPKAYEKAKELLKDISKHPREGIGKPEFLKYIKKWSRRINRFHRILYVIDDKKVLVSIASARGHYDVT